MNKSIKFFGHILSITSIVILAGIFIENYDKLKDIQLYWYSYAIIIMIIFLSLIGYLIMAFAWHFQLKDIYPKFSTLKSFNILATSQIAKYLPGNFGHYVGRYFLSIKYLKKADIIYSLMVENILFVLSSTIIGSIYLIYAPIDKWISPQELYMIIILVILLLPIIYWLNKKIKRKIVSLRINYLLAVKLLTLFICMTGLGGISIYTIFFLLTPIKIPPFWLLTSAFSLSFLLGFIIPGAPGGIGIREYVFTLLLTPFIGQIIALQAILFFRIISILSDLILFIVGKYIGKVQELNTHG